MNHEAWNALLVAATGVLDFGCPPPVYEFSLSWTCLSPEGCERMDEVERIDRMARVRVDCYFTSTQDASLAQMRPG